MLNHQTQPTYNTCVSTCLAILCDVPAKEIADKYHDRYMAGTWSLLPIMHELDIEAIPLSPLCNSMHSGRVYLVVAQSLNVPGGCHQIIADCRPDDDWFILDPAMGRVNDEGKRSAYYVAYREHALRGDEGCFSELNGMWAPEFWIVDCPAFRKGL